jgi:hypothetical protein
MVDVSDAAAKESVDHPEQGPPKGRHGYEVATFADGV